MPCSVVPGTRLFPLLSGVQKGPRCCYNDSDFRIIQVIGQVVQLAACRGLAVRCLPEKDLIHGNMVARHKFQKDMDTRCPC